ncbi:MAG: hypothetical protein A2X22_06975 [Bacteroidetes bacterium GWF2_49_14]|nr:MAG: hypothetical protein A2X22_06975 [Bacteroidetes bacterium GWF2_49_14]
MGLVSRMKKFNWKLKAGIIILILSLSTTPMILSVPFLPIATKSKVVVTTILIIIGNVTFYGGGFLVGKELFTKYKSYINPRNWFKKKKKKPGHLENKP